MILNIYYILYTTYNIPYMLYAICYIPYIYIYIYSIWYVLSSIQYIVYSIQHVVYSIQYIIYIIQYIVYSQRNMCKDFRINSLRIQTFSLWSPQGIPFQILQELNGFPNSILQGSLRNSSQWFVYANTSCIVCYILYTI